MMKEKRIEYITGATVARVIRTLKKQGIMPNVNLLKGRVTVPMANVAVPMLTWYAILEDGFTVEVSCETADGNYSFTLASGLDFLGVSCSEKANELPYLDVCCLNEYLSTMRPVMREPEITWVNKALAHA